VRAAPGQRPGAGCTVARQQARHAHSGPRWHEYLGLEGWGKGVVTVTVRSSDFYAWAPEVHQATGMILVQAGVDTVEALFRSVDYAHATGRTVQDTALEVVEGRLRFDDKFWG
jgi:hypothetical protein